MFYSKKTFSVAACLMSAMLVISCSQSGDQQSTDSGSADTTKSGSIVALSNSKVNVADGERFTLDITASDLPESEGGAVTLNYDSALVQVSAVNVDNNTWNFVNKNGIIDNVKGQVADIVFSSYSGVSGDAVIATVEFQSVNKGSSHITIEESSVNPFAANGEVITVSFEAANVVAN